jgi:hypothetical protein
MEDKFTTLIESDTRADAWVHADKQTLTDMALKENKNENGRNKSIKSCSLRWRRATRELPEPDD